MKVTPATSPAKIIHKNALLPANDRRIDFQIFIVRFPDIYNLRKAQKVLIPELKSLEQS
jgi:hypothetical protein